MGKLNAMQTSAGQRVAAVDEMGMGACPCACDSPAPPDALIYVVVVQRNPKHSAWQPRLDWPHYGEGSVDFVPLLLPELLLNPDGSW